MGSTDTVIIHLGKESMHRLFTKAMLCVLTIHTSLGGFNDGVDSSLKSAAKDSFMIGVGVGLNGLQKDSDLKLVKDHFQILTPENCMKPAAIQNERGVFTFSQADRVVDFGNQHGVEIVGHCLVWAKDDRTPEWFFQQNGEPVSKEVLLKRMKRHIDTVVGRYKDDIDQWDVVNEALNDGEGTYRPSGWQTAFGGPEFIVRAFEFARAADPTATLVYNDYRSELPGKREKLLELLRYLKANNAPIDAVGLQGHYELDSVPFEDLDYTISEIRKLGLKVIISEVDIDIVRRGQWWADGGKHREKLKSYDPYAEGCPKDVLQNQAEQYARLFSIYTKHAEAIQRVTFWNLHDGQSWLNYFPWNRANHPLLFDRAGKPKPAFYSVMKVLQSRD